MNREQFLRIHAEKRVPDNLIGDFLLERGRFVQFCEFPLRKRRLSVEKNSNIDSKNDLW